MTLERIELDSAGVRELLRSAALADHLKSIADSVASAAGPGFVSSVEIQSTRARASVHTATHEAMRAEHYHRGLTRALHIGGR